MAVEKDHSALEVEAELRRRGIDAIQVQFARQTVFVAAGAKFPLEDQRELEKIAGVERVINAPEPYQLVHRDFRPEGTCVDLGGGVAIGQGRFAVMADLFGESDAGALLRMAPMLARGRAGALIAGLPEGDGLAGERRRGEAIATLEAIRDATGLRIGIEAVTERDLRDTAATVDLFHVAGGRMQDYRFLQRVGATGKPVVLVRALSATLPEWLLAAEYLAATGNDRVILCERGIRSFTPETGRVTLDLASVARLREMTHLPVIVDPFQSSGSLSLGARLARAAVAAGADGVVVPTSFQPAAQGTVMGAEGLAGLIASLGPGLVAEEKQLVGAIGGRAHWHAGVTGHGRGGRATVAASLAGKCKTRSA